MPVAATSNTKELLVWEWDTEHADRRRETQMDTAVHHVQPFQVDRRVLKDVVREKIGIEVARIVFLNAGTFHKAYLITLVDGFEVVARVARRFMPRIKTESEVATMEYLRKYTTVPVPEVYHYDASPYNRLGGEYILMSKAPGIPLSHVFHSMSHNDLVSLLDTVAEHFIPLFGLRFSQIGSIYSGPTAESSAPTPRVTSGLSLTATPTPSYLTTPRPETDDFHVGPIVSWPFFGSNRGDLSHADGLSRGPWNSTYSYLLSCTEREISGVILENEGKAAPHRLHLDPNEIESSRHHHLQAVPGDQSDDSDEYDWEESEADSDGPGDHMYRDYRRMQRTTFLLAHMQEREEKAREEMGRFMRIMEQLGVKRLDGSSPPESFALDCHDLNLDNIFVDEKDNTKVTCIIDWESTTTRPLWACAHVPAFLHSSPFTTRLFRSSVIKLSEKGRQTDKSGYFAQQKEVDIKTLAKEWLFYEESGARLRMAHRCIEWDGWEEGLVSGILGPEDQEGDWFHEWEEETAGSTDSPVMPETVAGSDTDVIPPVDGMLKANGLSRKRVLGTVKVVAEEKEKEKHLGSNGDYCGGIGGELGRRLEAWLYINGNGEEGDD